MINTTNPSVEPDKPNGTDNCLDNGALNRCDPLTWIYKWG